MEKENTKIINNIIIDENKENPDIHFIGVYDNNLTKKMCKEMINLFEENVDYHSPGATEYDRDLMMKQQSKPGEYISLSKKERVKKCTDLPLYNDERIPLPFKKIKKKIYSKIEEGIQKYTSDLVSKYYCKFAETYKIFGCQMQKYIKNEDRFNYHSDDNYGYLENEGNDFHRNFRHGEILNRNFTYMWYLNDVEDGGETEFLNGKYKIKPKAGTLVVFPSTWTYMHKGNTPISNDKYIITGWIGLTTTPNSTCFVDFCKKHKDYFLYSIVFLIICIFLFLLVQLLQNKDVVFTPVKIT